MLFKTLKIFLVTSLSASIPIVFGKDCYDYFCYKKALKEAKNYAIKIINKVQRETVNNGIDSIVRSNFSWPFKTILLKLIKMEECYNLVCLLHSRLQNISCYDQKTKFNFIITDEFIKYYKNFKYDNVLENVRTCLRFVNSYLEYNKKKLFSNSPTSFEQIPDWYLVKQLIAEERMGISITPLDKPQKVDDELHFKFQATDTAVYGPSVYEIKIKKD